MVVFSLLISIYMVINRDLSNKDPQAGYDVGQDGEEH